MSTLEKDETVAEDKIDIDLQITRVDLNQNIISTLEKIIHHLKNDNMYTSEDKELLLYRTEEFVTGERKSLDPETLRYLFTGWFINNHCLRL